MSLTVPSDVTLEELFFLDLVKKNMLKKLTDRRKVIFLYCFELGNSHRDVAEILGIHETNVSRHIKGIREVLMPFK